MPAAAHGRRVFTAAHPTTLSVQEGSVMGDLIYLAAGAALFLVLGLYGRLLGRL
jgi:hypothetical protein